ncbi:MAG: YvcK family protein, partial [Deltaproteobacteria bacterium]|nr:YvcK family protein [Deltaproteobacteria bacterium]
MALSKAIMAGLKKLSMGGFSPLDLLHGRTLPEKLTELVLSGVPVGPPQMIAGLKHMAAALRALDGSRVRVVVFGGGTGVSTIIGGDSRSAGWMAEPFIGLKAVFPRTQAIVCVTDDGGSTGELQKDLPLIGLGDLRHVLLSSIQEARLRTLYQLDAVQARQTAAGLFTLFNYRYQQSPAALDDLLAADGLELDKLPAAMTQGIMALLARLFTDPRLTPTMARPHCLGNLLLTSAIYRYHKTGSGVPSPDAVRGGIRCLAGLFGAPPDAVLPCTTTPAKLKMIYSNGVQVSGEYKSSLARRGYPVDRVCIDFAVNPPQVLPEVLDAIGRADIIIFAPGSLYTSIVPVMQVPGLAQAVRDNQR